MSPTVRKSFAFYQLFYGTLGVLYDSYFLLQSLSKGGKLIIVTLALTLFSALVFLAGYYALKAKSTWVLWALTAQALQIMPVKLSIFYAIFCCGISYKYYWTSRIFSINLLDLNSKIAWRTGSDYEISINLFAITVCVVLGVASLVHKRN